MELTTCEVLPIVITSINPPTRAILDFCALDGCHCIIVGDVKTPAEEYRDINNLQYISVEDQKALGYTLAQRLPLNHYCRKNLGYLVAIQSGVHFIGETDDDNFPKPEWPRRMLDTFRNANRKIQGARFINIYQEFTDEFVWPRGFPLDWISRPVSLEKSSEENKTVFIVQGLADCNPDLDAIFRLVYSHHDILFSDQPAIFLGDGVYCPFNSQNTVWVREAFYYMYLPVLVRFRFTDILRSYVAQRGIRELGGSLAFCNATVIQYRNQHNIYADFEDEIDCYIRIEEVVDVLEAITLKGDPRQDLVVMYESLAARNVVPGRELGFVKNWISDVGHII